MDELIKSILKTEADAQQLVADVKRRETSFESDCHEKQAQLVRELDEKCRKRIELIEADEQKQLSVQLDEIKRDADEKMKNLDAMFEKNAAQWTDALVNNILGGD